MADGQNDHLKVKLKKEPAREQAKAEKLRKFQKKQTKMNAAAAKMPAEPKERKKVNDSEKLAPYAGQTPSGEKKILEDFESPYAKAYHPGYVEASWYEWWEKEGFFKPKFQEDGSILPAGHFVIPIPPPNVTGNLHIGHALANALQDTLIRWYRMRGFSTLFVPGCDHAGIATQVVVEKRLWKMQKKTRHDVGREELVDIIWGWKEEYHQRIRNVLRAMGGSYDWDREAFTMSPQLSKAVIEHFVRLYDEGLIYRGNRLVNWCTHLRTSLSNLEVENISIEKKTLIEVPGYDKKVAFGVLLYFKYPVDGTTETITVATTRPETMLGDTGIAVNPNDARYQHLIGKKARHPFVDRVLPIFADEYVDPEFGSGAVKMTPAHDQNDYALGRKHNLEFINILTEDGKLNANAGPLFEGQRRFDARYTVKTELEKCGLYVKEKDNPMVIPVCERSRDVVEFVLKPQFWVKMKTMAAEAKKVVEDGTIKIRPESSRQSYLRWMSDVHDWCISRQLWWGHRNPAWLVKFAGEPVIDDDEHWIAARDVEEAQKKAEAKFPGRKFELEQDPDVSDTWFSSGLFPFSSLGWPDKTEDFENFFPMSVLETGWDILPFWVARMIMLSLKHTGQVPFNEVFCHSLVRDSEGRKMSKSLGNVISPLDVMGGITLEKLHQGLQEGNLAEKEIAKAEKYQKSAFPKGIPECGADALRFSLVQYTTGGGDIAFSVDFIYAIRRFSNKIWQATKYCVGKLSEGFIPSATVKLGKESLPERWILSRMNHTVKRINEQLENREFSATTQLLHTFIQESFCDVFIENSKGLFEGSDEEKRSVMNTLYTVNETSLLLLSPFMPFISEELWQRLPRRPQDSTPSITVAKFPIYSEELNDPEAELAYRVILDAAKAIRSLAAEYMIPDAKLYVKASDQTTLDTLLSEHSSLRSLSGRGIASIDILSLDKATLDGCAVNVASATCAVFLEVRGNIQPEVEIAKARKKLTAASEGAAKQRKIMSNPDWHEKISPAVREIERARLEEYSAQQRSYEQSIQQFEKLQLES